MNSIDKSINKANDPLTTNAVPSSSISKRNDLESNGATSSTNSNNRDQIAAALLMHSYHLPGYTYGSDLYQYMTNNHPVFGICCHHPYHPLGFWIRIVSLIGSALFGLALTNIIYLAFVFTDSNYDTTYVAIPATNVTNGNMVISTQIEETVPSAISITNGNIALWTIGSTIHALYDNMIWKLAACACCVPNGTPIAERQQRYKSFGSFLVMFSVVVVVAIATFAVALRNALDDGTIPEDADAIDTLSNVNVYKTTSSKNDTSSSNDTSGGETVVLMQEVDSTNDLEFMIAYCIELLLNYFIYYPIVGFILFTGILSCNGKFQLFGGRPYEVSQEYQEHEKDKANAT